jgi:hypothetical protein
MLTHNPCTQPMLHFSPVSQHMSPGAWEVKGHTWLEKMTCAAFSGYAKRRVSRMNGSERHVGWSKVGSGAPTVIFVVSLSVAAALSCLLAFLK